MNFRLLPTPLDGTIAQLGLEGDIGNVGNTLFRAGLRSDVDVARMSRAQLLAIPRLGAFGREVVAALKDKVGGVGTETSRSSNA